MNQVDDGMTYRDEKMARDVHVEWISVLFAFLNS